MELLNNMMDCALSALHSKNELLAKHSLETANIAVTVGVALELPEEDLRLLRVTGIMHDIGKMDIYPEILLKPGELTLFEREQVKAHPYNGVQHIKRVPYLMREFGDRLIMAVYRHHEEPDGTGYPNGKTLKDLDTITRILIVSDKFQAMTNERAYRKAYDPELVADGLLKYLIMPFFLEKASLVSLTLKAYAGVGGFMTNTVLEVQDGVISLKSITDRIDKKIQEKKEEVKNG